MSPDDPSLEWDTKAWREHRDQRMLEWLGDADAVHCAIQLSFIAEVWDDIVDGATPTADRVNRAFQTALIGLEFNPFYQRHKGMILPIVMVGINAWLDANELERREGKRYRMAAFFLRNTAYEVASIIATCALGWDGMRKISLPMREFFSHETYDEWEHRHQEQAP